MTTADRTRQIIAALTAGAVVLAGCTAAPNPPPPLTSTQTSGTSSAETSSAAPSIANSSAVGAAIDWYVDVLNGATVTAADYEARFAAGFRTQVPFDTAFQPVLDQLRPAGPFVLVEPVTVEPDSDGVAGQAVLESRDGTRIIVSAELDDAGKVAGLLVQPADPPELDDPPTTVVDALDRLAEIGTLRAVLAEVVDGSCVPVESRSAAEPTPLGSAIKLYVLAALGEAVLAGTVGWDDPVEIRDELKSIPSGVLQNRAAGETLPVREVAELMIAISDNTATDHLIALLGREEVERLMSGYGNTSAALNIPLLTTREFAALKVGPTAALRQEWIDGDEAARRRIVADLADVRAADLPMTTFVDPVDPDTVEWFATPDDLCELAVRLEALAERVPEVAQILSVNPGVAAAPGTWDSLWFKGGSEPGLVAVWWRTEVDGRIFVAAGSVVDPHQPIDEGTTVLLFAAARDLLAP